MRQEVSALVHLKVPCDRFAPSLVREAIHELEPMGWVVGDLMLVASELVTNAVLYSGCSALELLEVQVEREGDRLIVEVRDPGRSDSSAELVSRDVRLFGGMGLWIVDKISRRWGTERRDGYRVWAELPLMPC